MKTVNFAQPFEDKTYPLHALCSVQNYELTKFAVEKLKADVLAATEWRIANGQTIGDHWIVSEVSMYSDKDCSVALTPISVGVSSMDYGVACGDPDGGASGHPINFVKSVPLF